LIRFCVLAQFPSAKLTALTDETRRRFLSQCATTVAGAWLLRGTALADDGPHVKFPVAPRERIAVASYPFREFVKGADYKGSAPPIELKNFAGHVKSRFDVNNIEPWSAHFPSTDRQYLDTLREAIEKAHCGVANIAVDGEHSPYAADKSEREQAIAFSKQWVDVAAIIGSPSIRINIPTAKDSPPDLERAADSLRGVVEYSGKKHVVVHLENDNPVSEDPFFLVKLVERVGSPWLHPLPDFANSLAHKDADYAYRGIEQLFAHAYGICHVKKMEQADNGQVVHVDLAKTFGILKASGYRGYCSMEFDSPGDPYRGTQELIDDTIRYLS
jgi:sugar phosphate isomerase/epimerase